VQIHVKPISPVQNRDFGKKKELSLGEARVNSLRVGIFSKEVADELSLTDLTAPPERVTIEVLWHDHATIDKYKRWVREHPEHELVE
jgi:hypothetical protein